jgi:hypothetical protein
MSKVGGRRNFGYGKTLAWAGKNALRDRYGEGHFASQAAHVARWNQFAKFARSSGVRDARDVTLDLVRLYASTLASQVERSAMSVRYAQNLVSTVNVVLETLRGDRRLRLSPATLVGRRVDRRTNAPASLDRRIVDEHIRRLEHRGHTRVAVVVALARELGLRFREASLLDAKTALREARATGEILVRRGTKGGRGKEIERRVPVTQRALVVLIRAAELQADNRNIIPPGTSYRGWRNQAYGVCRGAGDTVALSGFHDLRAAYACERYQELGGAPAPTVVGERRAPKEADRAARRVIAQELGHGRIEVVASYVGSAR